MNKLRIFLKNNWGKIFLLIVIILMIYFQIKEKLEIQKRDPVPEIVVNS